MNYIIREAVKQDMNSVLELIKELAVYLKASNIVTIDKLILENEGFGENPLFKCFVAEIDFKIVGMSLIYHSFSTWKGRSIHLEDLIVKEEFRNLGIGNSLFKQVMIYAKSQKAKRIEWVVSDWNSSAIKFYTKKGATLLENWTLVQLHEDRI